MTVTITIIVALVALVALALLWLAVLLNDSADVDEAREWEAEIAKALEEACKHDSTD